jgi:hypothetical protein
MSTNNDRNEAIKSGYLISCDGHDRLQSSAFQLKGYLGEFLRTHDVNERQRKSITEYIQSVCDEVASMEYTIL